MNQGRILRLKGLVGTDLRDAGPGMAGAGKVYEVSPAAVANLRRVLAAQEKSAKKRIVKQVKKSRPAFEFKSRSDRMKNVDLKHPLIASEFYPQAVVKAAANELALVNSGKKTRPVLTAVFTDAVVETWRELRANNPGMTIGWLAKNNGLIPVSNSVIQRRLSDE